MPIAAHLAALKEKHAALDRMIQDQERRPWSNEVELKSMKLKKLHLKEEIETLEKSNSALAAE